MAQPVVVEATVVEEGRSGSAPVVVQGSVVQDATAPQQAPGKPPAQCTVVGRPTQVVMGAPVGVADPRVHTQHGPAEDPSLLAFVACLCCCWCTGILAIVQAREVPALNARGDYDRAHEARKRAMTLIHTTVGLGVLIAIVNTAVATRS